MSDLTVPKRERILILPLPILLLMGVFFVGAAFLLIPKEEELLNRFLEDQNTTRAKAMVDKVKKNTAEAEAAAWVKSVQDRVAAAAEAAQLNGFVDDGSINSEETLKAFLGEGTCRPGEVAFPDLVVAVRSTETPESGEILDQLRLAGADEKLDEDDWKTLEATIAEKALAEGDPDLAADLLLSACGTADGPTEDWERVRIAVKSCRWANRPEDAAAFLAGYDTVDLPEDIIGLRVTVLQEVGRNDEAFAAVIQYIAALDEEAPVPESLMTSAEQTGMFSGQGKALLPIYRRHLNATRIGRLTWEEFLAAAEANELGDTGSYTRYAKTFARLCEWNALPDEGFNHYRKIAVIGDWEATSRCLALYLGLARQMDMEEILARTVQPESSSEGELGRLYLQLIGGNGHYEKAVPEYRNWLARNPSDVDAWFELTLLIDEMGDFDAALKSCDEALKIHGKHIGLRTHMARLLQSRGDYKESLAILREFSPEEHTAVTREDYELLSEAVGAWEDFNKAIRLSIQATEKPKVEQFEALARSCELLQDPEGEVKALENGLRIHPRSKTLALNLASTLVDQGRFEDAVEVLTEPALKEELSAVCLLIDTAGRVENPEFVYQHLGPAAHRRYKLPAGSLLALSEIYQAMGQTEAAAEIFEGLPMGPAQWEMIAELRFKQQRYDEAKLYQEKVTKDSTDHYAWMFLGEILQELGDAAGAEVAFKKSLNLLRSRIVSENESVAGR